MNLRNLFLLPTSDTPTAPLADLIAMLTGKRPATLTEAVEITQAEGWPKFPGREVPFKDALQSRSNELVECIAQLGMLNPCIGPLASFETATHAIWPGASLGQCGPRLAGGMEALRNKHLPQLTSVDAIAAFTRKPLKGELDDISLTLPLDYNQIVTPEGFVREGEMMRCWWEKEVKAHPMLSSFDFDVITTDRIPPSGISGRATNISTLEAWWMIRSAETVPPKSVVVWSACPYLLRFMMEAEAKIPAVTWIGVAGLPKAWNVAGTLAEIAKILYGLNAGI